METPWIEALYMIRLSSSRKRIANEERLFKLVKIIVFL